MGATAIATYLNEHGYVKKKRQNNTLDLFSAHFVKLVLDNPVYCGKLAYGRRKKREDSRCTQSISRRKAGRLSHIRRYSRSYHIGGNVAACTEEASGNRR